MNRDYKARSGELADVVRLVSTQARQILFMRRVLELKPWADRRDSEIKALKQQLADQATALAVVIAEKNQLEADIAETKVFKDRIEELKLELFEAKAEQIAPPLPLIPPSVPTSALRASRLSSRPMTRSIGTAWLNSTKPTRR